MNFRRLKKLIKQDNLDILVRRNNKTHTLIYGVNKHAGTHYDRQLRVKELGLLPEHKKTGKRVHDGALTPNYQDWYVTEPQDSELLAHDVYD